MTRTLREFYIREEDAPAKREVLRAAMKLFSERGLAGTSIRDIAAESGYTNPALYKHFESKEELALTLFEVCHQRVWGRLDAALRRGTNFATKLDAYVGEYLALVDEHPEVIAFLSDSARVLWPKASQKVKRHTVIGLARSLALSAQRRDARAANSDTDLVAATLQGALAEFARMLQVGVLDGPAARWRPALVALFRRIAG
jgi:AcrR family transcriptional regulator